MLIIKPSLLYSESVRHLKALLTYHVRRMKIVGALVLLTASFMKLDTKWCSILVHRVRS